MATGTTTLYGDSVRDLYASQYLQGAEDEVLYAQYCQPVGQLGVESAARLGATLYVPFISKLPIATSAISQVADITPRTLRDAKASITTTSRGDAIQTAELVDLNVYTDHAAARVREVGSQASRSIDWYTMSVLMAGTLVQRAAARASLDAGTSGHRLSDASFIQAQTRLQRMGCPTMRSGNANYWTATVPSEAYADLVRSGNVINYGSYAQASGEIVLNFELGKLGAFKILSSPNAKVFGAAGADNASVVATTIAAPLTAGHNDALGLSMEVASASNLVVGMQVWLGTEETANTFDSTMEPVTVASIASTTIGIVGTGPNGGLLYDHPVGTSVRNADSVYPVLYGSPFSAAKAFDAQTGEFGTMLDPEWVGNLKQFQNIAWKWYGGVGLYRQNTILRGEYAASYDA